MSGKNVGPHIFILVHGTFAREASWATEKSPLGSTLRKAYPAAEFVIFSWSGKNTHSARLSAASDLGRKIADVASNAPGAKVHLIAHSHGGNIAFYSCRDAEIAAKVTSVVCIATPFIICGLRDIDFLIWRLFTFASGVVIMGLMLTYFAVARVFEKPISYWGVGLATWAAIIIINEMRSRAMAPSINKLSAVQRSFSDRVALPVLDIPVLVVKTSRDEAALWLKLWSRAITLPHSLQSLLFIAAMLVSIAMLPAYYYVRHSGGIADIQAMYEVWFATMALGLATFGLVLALTFVFRANPMVFGWESIGCSLVVALAAWTAPSFMAFHTLDIRLNTFRLMRHSALYSHGELLRYLPAWVAKADQLRDGSKATFG